MLLESVGRRDPALTKMVANANLLTMLLLCTNSVMAQWSNDAYREFNCTISVLTPQNRSYVQREVVVNSQSCSYTPLLKDVTSPSPSKKKNTIWSRMNTSCTGTNKIALNLTLQMFHGYEVECSAAFPLDVDLARETPFDSDVHFQKTGNAFSAIFNNAIIGDEMCTFTGNFTFFSANNASLSTTIEFSVRDMRYVVQDLGLGISVKRENITEMPMIACFQTQFMPTYVAMAVGPNPTRTRLLMDCLRPKSFQCPDEIYRGKAFDEATAETKQHGVLYCSNEQTEDIMNFFSPVKSCDVLNVSSIWDEANVLRIQKDDAKSHLVVPRRQDYWADPKTNVAAYENDFLSLECHFLRYALDHAPTWIARYANGTEHTFPADEVTREEKYCKNEQETVFNSLVWMSSSHVRIQSRAGMIAVECQANYWNFRKTAKAVLPVTIKSLSEARAPTFYDAENERETSVGSFLQLECVADVADPGPVYSWKFIPQDPHTRNSNSSLNKLDVVATGSLSGRGISILRLRQFVPSMEGEYVCTAENVRGSAKQSYKVYLNKENGTSAWIYILLAVGITALVGMSAMWYSRKYFIQQGRLSALEIMMFEKGDANQLRSDQYAHENAQYMPYNRGYEIKWNDFKILEEAKLGEGEYGIVFKGCLVKNPNQTTAIKTLKPGADKAAILALLSELKVMIHLESHDNIVRLIGACTEFLRDGRLYVMAEFCQLGGMDSYLRKLDKKLFREMHVNFNSANVTAEINLNYESGNYLTVQDLVSWAVQIARGMQHLEKKKVIHGDLATRNVLLYSKTQVKITDFGLSRQLLNYQNYVKKSQAKLPWRWLALETLKSLTFSHKSDVWAYGVTLWEIFTLGQVPYPGINWTMEFVQHLEDNLRLSQPKFATNNMYKIMSRCWDAEQENRPNFQQLEAAFCALSEYNSHG